MGQIDLFRPDRDPRGVVLEFADGSRVHLLAERVVPQRNRVRRGRALGGRNVRHELRPLGDGGLLDLGDRVGLHARVVIRGPGAVVDVVSPALLVQEAGRWIVVAEP